MRQLLLFFVFCWGLSLGAQVSNSLGVWVDHLPYRNAVDVEEYDDAAYVATEQGLVIYDLQVRTLQRVSKVNGLADVGLTTIAFSPRYQQLLIGYENGNIDIYQDGEVTNFPDLRLSDNYRGLKRINHINILDSLAFFATDFGILAYDLDQDLVRQTYIIGEQGGIMAVEETAQDQDYLYAATAQGLLRAPLNSAKFFFQNWERVPGMRRPVNKVTVFNDSVFVNVSRGNAQDSIWFQASDGQPWQFFDKNEIAQNNDLSTSRGTLIVVNSFSARAYDAGFNFVKNWNAITVNNPEFNPQAAVMGSNPENFWIADRGQCLYHVFQIFPFQESPNSPGSRNIYRMRHTERGMFLSPGSISTVGAPLFNNEGFYGLTDLSWQNYSNASFAGYQDIVDVIEHPEDPNRVYASSYGTGILELEFVNADSVRLVRLIDAESTNGALAELPDGGHRIAQMDRDPEGNIWFSNAFTDRPLGVIRPDGTVESYSLGAAGSGATVLEIMATEQSGQVWLQIRDGGVLVANIRDGEPVESALLTSAEGSGNLPSETVLAFAEDQDGEIWIGTNEGLAVLFSPDNIFEPNRGYDASILVIDEDGDGNGERVLGSEAITDIEVDGSNKKWFGTTNSGVFYTNENGRVQLQRFSRENSPLVSNSIQDIEIDAETGMVYFGTDQGIVSFQGQATEGVAQMNDVFAYPNPVPPQYEGPILIRGLVTNAQVKITDIEGNIVFETVAEGGQAIWDGTTFSGQKVRSGIYLAYITDDLGANTAIAKVMILR